MHINTIKSLVAKANNKKRKYLLENENFTLIIRNASNYGEIFFKGKYDANLDVIATPWLKALKGESPKISFKDIPLKIDANGKPHILNGTALLDSRMQRIQSFTFTMLDVVTAYKEVLTKDFPIHGDYHLHTTKSSTGHTVTTVWTTEKMLVTFFVRGIEDEDIVMNPLFVG